ncbi:hypothetical protein PIB30_043543 [Stylosanthes scabra]|uniref:Uncharacterized protein n=1 Tax=Stylosanthes scabra TaxID=79078 RepID=A0ABU6WDY3_9FABA|nr:hypothetical protein [Stylosanthes scabra]
MRGMHSISTHGRDTLLLSLSFTVFNCFTTFNCFQLLSTAFTLRTAFKQTQLQPTAIKNKLSLSLPEQNDPSLILGILVAPCDTSVKTSRHRLRGIRCFQTTTTKASPPKRACQEYNDIDVEETAELGMIKMRSITSRARSSPDRFMVEGLTLTVLICSLSLRSTEEVVLVCLGLRLQLLWFRLMCSIQIPCRCTLCRSQGMLLHGWDHLNEIIHPIVVIPLVYWEEERRDIKNEQEDPKKEKDPEEELGQEHEKTKKSDESQTMDTNTHAIALISSPLGLLTLPFLPHCSSSSLPHRRSASILSPTHCQFSLSSFSSVLPVLCVASFLRVVFVRVICLDASPNALHRSSSPMPSTSLI